MHQHAANEFTLAEAFCSLPPPSTTPSPEQCPTRITSHARRTGEGPRIADLGHLAGPNTLELPGQSLKNNTKQEKKKSKRDMRVYNCPDGPSRKRPDSCQPLEILGLLPTSKLEHILIYKNDSLGLSWADCSPQAMCLGAPRLVQQGVSWEMLGKYQKAFGGLNSFLGKHTQGLTLPQASMTFI